MYKIQTYKWNAELKHSINVLKSVEKFKICWSKYQ